MEKRYFKPLFALFAIMLYSVVYAQDFSVDNINYEIVYELNVDDYCPEEYEMLAEDGYGGQVSVVRPTEYLPEMCIPSMVTYNGKWYEVVSIKSGAFSDLSHLISITIQIGREGGWGVYYSIGDNAFSYCSDLETVNFVVNVDWCELSLGESVFESCSSLSSVSIPNCLSRIPRRTFYRCESLQEITIPASVTTIEEGAFARTSLSSISVDQMNPIYDSRDNCNAIIETASNKVILACKNTIIPSTANSIGTGAYCTYGITSVHIPFSITNIAANAWLYYDEVFSVSELNSIVVQMENCKYTSGECANVIIECSSQTLILGCANSTIPNGVMAISASSFYGCTGLSSIDIPNSVQSIGWAAFSYCTGLTSVTIGNSVTTINDNAFYGCTGLTSVTVMREQPITITDNVFTNRANATLYVPSGSKFAYEAADYWKDFKEIIEVEPEKCATPTISFANGQLRFECETEDVEFVYDIDVAHSGKGNVVSLTGIPATYRISVYATKEGKADSDVATCEVDYQAKMGDTNSDGSITIADAVAIVDIILGRSSSD